VQTLFSKGESQAVQIHEGAQLGSAAQPITETVIDVTPGDGQSIRLRANLIDDDLIGDDTIGDETTTNLFESGWRKDVTITLTGSDALVRVTLSMTPI
jgi:hypothetical protein